jgi:hypothetical protein
MIDKFVINVPTFKPFKSLWRFAFHVPLEMESSCIRTSFQLTDAVSGPIGRSDITHDTFGIGFCK